jgi:predicted SprT family Zn-dependent metalloprotease
VVATKSSLNYHSNDKQALGLYILFLQSIKRQQSQQLHLFSNQLYIQPQQNQLDHYLDTLQKSNTALITALPNAPTIPIPTNVLKKKYVSTHNLENFLYFFLNKRYVSRINWAQTYVQKVDQIRIDMDKLFAPEISQESTYFQYICELRNIESTYIGSIRNETFYGSPNYAVPIVNISNSDANDIILMLEYFRNLVKYNIQNYPNQKYPNIPNTLLSYKSNHSNPITSNGDPFNVTDNPSKQNTILKVIDELEDIARNFKVTLGINDEWMNKGLIRVNEFIVDPFGIYYYQDFYSQAKLPLIELFGSKIALFALAHDMSVEKAYRKVLIHELAHAVQHRGGNHIHPKWSQGNSGNSIMSQVSDILIEGSAQLYTKMLSRMYDYESEYYNILDHSSLEYQIQEIWYFLYKSVSISMINAIFDQLQSNDSIPNSLIRSSKINNLGEIARNLP